jgi:hypothetical protein
VPSESPTQPTPKTGAPEPAEEKRLGDLLVAAFPAREPAKVGEDAIRIRVRDAAGNPVTGATVRFDYSMDMPGMSIEQSQAAEVGPGIYEGKAKFTMGGPWGINVEIQPAGKPAVRGKFTVRVAS